MSFQCICRNVSSFSPNPLSTSKEKKNPFAIIFNNNKMKLNKRLNRERKREIRLISLLHKLHFVHEHTISRLHSYVAKKCRRQDEERRWIVLNRRGGGNEEGNWKKGFTQVPSSSPLLSCCSRWSEFLVVISCRYNTNKVVWLGISPSSYSINNVIVINSSYPSSCFGPLILACALSVHIFQLLTMMILDKTFFSASHIGYNIV